jgi:hypothetical protein
MTWSDLVHGILWAAVVVPVVFVLVAMATVGVMLPDFTDRR